MALLGKTHVRILGVQPEFCRKGEGDWIALPNGLWHFFSEYEPLLRNQICIIFHHYLPWFTSEYHLRIMFDHSYCQNVHSQSQNRCFKEFANFWRKIPATKRPFAWGGGVETLFGRMPFEHAFSLHGSSLSAVHCTCKGSASHSWVQIFVLNECSSLYRWVQHSSAQQEECIALMSRVYCNALVSAPSCSKSVESELL